MKMRLFLNVFLCVACLAACWTAIDQHGQLTRLEARERELARQSSGESAQSAPATSDSNAASPAAVPVTVDVPVELLRLRNESGQLSRRIQELEGMRAENQRLNAQVASHRAEAATGPVLPAGYIRKSKAQRTGFNTPEDAFQTFLWALANHDLDTLYESLVPESSEQMKAMVEKSGAEQFFEEARSFPGGAITDRQTLPDGSIKLMIQIVPDGASEAFTARQINGQWKISMP